MRIVCLAALFLLCFSAGAQRLSAADYLARYAPIATSMMDSFSIPASVMLGIAMVESGGGNSRNCRLLHNHFGMKGSNDLQARGLKYRSRYKGYENDTASYVHFCTYLSERKFYPLLKGNMHYRTWLKKISASGYARAKKRWLYDVSYIIRKYHLSQFDVKNNELGQ